MQGMGAFLDRASRLRTLHINGRVIKKEIDLLIVGTNTCRPNNGRDGIGIQCQEREVRRATISNQFACLLT